MRWTLGLLEQAAHSLADIGPISRETIRLPDRDTLASEVDAWQ